MKKMTLEEYKTKGNRLFGEKLRDWKVVCPQCKTVQSGQDFADAGLKIDEIQDYFGFSCIGRLTKKKGCDWSLGGLFKIHVLVVITPDGKEHPRFDFAE